MLRGESGHYAAMPAEQNRSCQYHKMSNERTTGVWKIIRLVDISDSGRQLL